MGRMESFPPDWDMGGGHAVALRLGEGKPCRCKASCTGGGEREGRARIRREDRRQVKGQVGGGGDAPPWSSCRGGQGPKSRPKPTNHSPISYSAIYHTILAW